MANKLLLIGIDRYKNRTGLNNCVKDVSDVRDILIDKYDFEDVDTKELFDEEATNKEIQDTFKIYASLIEKTDNLVIYFSGHGEYEEGSKTGFWVPYDGDSHYTTWIANETIKTLLDNLKAKHIFLISDSCFSNTLLNQLPPKSNVDYSTRASRWGLGSAFKNSYDSTKGGNSSFAATIIDFLKTTDRDFKVSDLINHVKASFATNIAQTPQGSPLMLAGHAGGEMVFSLKLDHDSRRFKGYEDFPKTLDLYRRNCEFKKINIYEDKSLKVGFSLFQEHDSVKKKVSYYLYLYEGINQSKTLTYLRQNHREIFSKDLILFLSKEKNQVNIETRKSNIEKKFSPLSAFYIDDFIRLYCTTSKFFKYNNEDYLGVSNFVLPSIKSESTPGNLQQFIFDWFKKDDDPILVIVGTGGVGKTTFAQYIADKAININKNTFVMFIDSVLIKDGLLRRRSYAGEIKLYNFYEALHEQNNLNHEKLSEDLFRMNLDAGNILIIIDGLDEVISKISDFDVNLFLKSISDNNKEIGSGKVIITCRTHFWDNTDILESRFNTIELLPFNNEQTKNFFEISFNNDIPKVKRALKLAEEFKYPGEQHNYHPYVLDIIRSIITTDDAAIEADLSEFSSKILKSFVNNDYIIYRICDRERKRIGQISVEDQLKFFIHLAIEKRGVIDAGSFKDTLKSTIGRAHIDKSNIEAFKAHPFLMFHERTCRFRYDFLTDYFKGVYLTSFFEYKEEEAKLTQLFINIIFENCWFGAPIIIDVANRIAKWEDEDILYVNDIIEQIPGIENDEGVQRKTIANIFNISLMINIRFRGRGVEENTALLLGLFQKQKNQVENLSIININSLDHKIKFDFSNLTVNKAYLDNFSSFWDCKMNESTFFIESHLLNLSFNRKQEMPISQNNFRDCITDETVSAALLSNQETKTDKKGKAKFFLDDFFHLFLSNGRIERQSVEDVIKTRFGGINKYAYPYKDIIKILKKREIVTTYENFKGSKIEVQSQYKEEVFKFVKDGTISIMISNLIDDISKL